MTTNTNNSRTSQAVSPKLLKEDMDKAKQCHISSKTQATEALGHLYLLARATCSASALPSAKKWLSDEIAKRNTEIDALNAALADGSAAGRSHHQTLASRRSR